MSKLIARLISCGIPRKVALAIYRSFRASGKIRDFEGYVESIERETWKQEEYEG